MISQPLNVTAVSVPGTVTVSWDPPEIQDTPVTLYYVDCGLVTVGVGDSVHTFLVPDDLPPGEYTFLVQALDDGQANYSDFSNAIPSNTITATAVELPYISVNTPDGNIHVAANLLDDGRIEQSVALTQAANQTIDVNIASSVGLPVSGTVQAQLMTDQADYVSPDHPLPVTVTNSPSQDSIEVSNFPATQNVAVTNPTTTVSVSNFPDPVTSVSVDNFPDPLPVNIMNDGGVAGNWSNPLDVQVTSSSTLGVMLIDPLITVAYSPDHPLPVMQAAPQSSVMTTVDVADMQVTLVAADPNRMRVGLHNHSNDSLYVACSDTVSDTSFSQVVTGHSYMEMDYSGIVTAVRPAGSATGPVMMTSYLMGG